MSIIETKVQIYSDGALENLVTEASGTTSLNQSVDIIGLANNTTYFARVTAKDNNNRIGYSNIVPFTTAHVQYSFIAIITDSSIYNAIDCDITARCSQQATFTETGIILSTDPTFQTNVITASSNGDSFVDEVENLDENTLYYYKYYTITEEFGYGEYIPQPNTISTRYAPPTFDINVQEVTDTTAVVRLEYIGNYPITNISLAVSPVGGYWTILPISQTRIQFVNITGLTPNTDYDLEAAADYYDGEITESAGFVTLPLRPTVEIDDIYNVGPISFYTDLIISSADVENSGVVVKNIDETYEFSEEGYETTIVSNGVSPHTTYDVVPFVDDHNYGRIYGESAHVTTLQGGGLTISNVSAVWGTQTPQLTFSCNWASTYNVQGASANFKVFVSQTSDFSSASEIAPNWTRQLDGLSGTLNATLTQRINTSTPNSDYYVKVQLTDVYGEILQQIFHYYTPTSQAAGAMSFTTNIYNDFTGSTTSTVATSGFTYALKFQSLMYSDDNWATMHSSGSWRLNQSITTNFTPNYWETKLEVVDIYGNRFYSSQIGNVDIVKPQLSLFDTHRGAISYVLYLNPRLAYDTADLIYSDGNTGDTIDLLPTLSDNMYGEIPDMPDGTYDVICKIRYAGTEYADSGVKSITIQMQGHIDLEDTSEITDGVLYWAANFTSTFPMVTGTITAYKDDDNYEVLGSSTVTFDGTTSGIAKADNEIEIFTDTCVVIFNGTDSEGFSVTSEYWI